MNAILGMDEMILREAKDEGVLMYAESIRTAGNTLLGIINDILDFSKIEAGKTEIIEVDYHIAALLNDIVNMVRRKAEEKKLTFKLDVDEGIPKCLHGDEIKIKQVITNILSNAVKYTKEGGVTFSVSGRKCEDDLDSIILHVRVEDTGIGIKKEDLDKLFAAFERIDEKQNRSIEGTGLGMAIAERFLNLMGSTIQVESEYGKGAVFSFDLKQKVVNPEPLGEFETAYKNLYKERAPYQVQFVAPDAKVLVVDDNEINLKVFVKLLRQTKMQIDTAESGDACIELFKRNFYDVIFLDHMMPGKDGIETIKEMKECEDTPNQSTPIICLTANAVSGMREMYIKAGFDDYLTKPIDTGRLEGMLLNYLSTDLVQAPENESARKYSVLVIDEDIDYLRRIKEKLSELYEVVVVKSTEQALAYFKNHEADLILMDSQLPELANMDKEKILTGHFKEMSLEDVYALVNERFGHI
jgi:CheY-like chemotaxis protein